MRFSEAGLPGAWLIDVEAHQDERGLFARTFCRDEFAARGLPTEFIQCSTSYNESPGTLRGLHYQGNPQPEGKVVRCTQGRVFDVAVDLRKGTESFGRWVGVELSAQNRRAIYIPPGFAHGFLTLTEGAEVYYQMTVAYVPALSRGVRWDDRRIGIRWPMPAAVISAADRAWPLLEDAECF